MWIAGYPLSALVDELQSTGLDACTLNNALNIAQLVVLVALLKWVRARPDDASETSS